MRAATLLLATTGALQLVWAIPAAHAMERQRPKSIQSDPPSRQAVMRLVVSSTRGLIVGKSVAISKVREQVAAAVWRAFTIDRARGATGDAASCATGLRVLVRGESGTGKELIAKGFHHGLSQARQLVDQGSKTPFVPVNCGALIESLAVSHLFGHVSGAFTGAQRKNKGLFLEAVGGVLFLDEIGDLAPTAQAALFRAVGDTGEIQPVGGLAVPTPDVHIVAATDADLKSLRNQLVYRLKQEVIVVPPLRQRPEDIEPLVHHFATQAGRWFRFKGEEALKKARSYAWPGNVRELKELVEWSLARTQRKTAMVDMDLLQQFFAVHGQQDDAMTEAPTSFAASVLQLIGQKARNGGIPMAEANRLNRAWVTELAWNATAGDATAAASKLGVTEKTFLGYLADLRALQHESSDLPN